MEFFRGIIDRIKSFKFSKVRDNTEENLKTAMGTWKGRGITEEVDVGGLKINVVSEGYESLALWEANPFFAVSKMRSKLQVFKLINDNINRSIKQYSEEDIRKFIEIGLNIDDDDEIAEVLLYYIAIQTFSEYSDEFKDYVMKFFTVGGGIFITSDVIKFVVIKIRNIFWNSSMENKLRIKELIKEFTAVKPSMLSKCLSETENKQVFETLDELLNS